MRGYGWIAMVLAAGLAGCGGGGSEDSPPPPDEVSEIINGATRASSGSHWRRSLTQSTELIAFYSDGSGQFRSGGTCGSGAMTWTRTSSTSLSANLPATAGTNSCPQTLVLTGIAASGGQFSAASSSTGQTVTYSLVGSPIP